MQGARVNFSKSGMSLTAGVRGASISTGSRGSYVNTSIPGSGLYDRQRIDSTSSSNTSSNYLNNSTGQMTINVGIKSDGSYYIKDQQGNTITDETLLRKIKRSDAYKKKILELSKKFASDTNTETETIVDIYKQSAQIITEEEVKEQLLNLRAQKYLKKEYAGPVPNELSIKADVENEAKRNIKSLAFWTLKKKRAEYFERNYPVQLQKNIDSYNESKQKFDANETIIEKEKNKEYLEEYQSQQQYLQNLISGSKEFVENSIDTFLESMILPVNFEVSYEYEQNKQLLKVDLDLPEIEDLPTSKATTLSSGMVKLKEKTQKEIKEQYLICVTGLAFFFGSHLFNISTNIKNILLSAYTQRMNKKTGVINDEYVYSILFNREKIITLNVENIVPYLAFEEYKSTISYSKTFELSTITPMENYSEET